MNNLLRLLRMAGRFPITVASAIGLSFLIAAFWGGNIGALYPVFEVVMRGRSLPAWLRADITEANAKIAELESQREQLPLDDLRNRDALASRLQAERTALAIRQRVLPHAERYLPARPFDTVVALLAVLLVATLLKNLCVVGHAMLSARLVEKVTYNLREQVFQQILRLDQRTFATRGSADLASRFMTDVPQVSTGLQWFVSRMVGEPLRLLACGIGAALICWRLLLFSVLAAPLVALLLRVLAKAIRRENNTAYGMFVGLNQVVMETLRCLPAVQAYTMEHREALRMQAAANVCQRRARRVALFNVLTKPATELLGLTVLCLALLAGAYLVLNQQTHLLGVPICDRPLNLASLLIFYGMLIGMTDPLRKMSDAYASVQTGLVAAGRVFSFLDQPLHILEPRQPRTLARPHQQLEFADVSFAYTPDRVVLRDIRLTIPFGETIAIVGANGCGKSTLISLTARFHDPTAGSVRLDGVDLRELSLFDLRSRIGLVTQQAMLFDDTVAANIAYGTPGASFEQIERAARLARAHEFIDRELTHGYDSRCGELGGRLSGGQRQRIALARAILRDPELLILDEATSQIDLASEQLILDALRQVIGKRTTILITHRLSLLVLADRVVVMDAGRIIDHGRHNELLQRCDVYRSVHEVSQQKAA